MDMHKTYSVRVPKIVIKVALTAIVAGAIYFGVIWAGNSIVIMPASELQVFFQ